MPDAQRLSLDDNLFGRLVCPKRIWTVGAIHGEAVRLQEAHRQLIERFQPGDRLIYLGNILGKGDDVIAVMDSILTTRRRLLANLKGGIHNSIKDCSGAFEAVDFVYLRGAQEEMWTKILQLQFAPNPREVLEWLLDHGMEATLRAYGSNAASARGHCRDGAMAITKWTSALRAAMHRHPGHFALISSLRRAAYTDNGKLLFVHASVDPERPLSMQGDSFWWDTGQFETLSSPFSGFDKVIRGYDHKHKGLALETTHIATVDGGCGHGGMLNLVCFSPDGDVLDQIEV